MKDKTIVLGVTGGIAAYKAPELLRLMKRAGADVKVVMTQSAMEFVGELTFRALSGNPVGKDIFEVKGEWDVSHIGLAQEADLVVVAPATANIIGKAANGLADDLLSCVIMACRCPVLFAPAMNSAMYSSAAVQENIQKLISRGFHFIGPGTGELACGEGKGRMEEVPVIFDAALSLLTPKTMEGISVVITAGPTREMLDPVRFVSNPSTGLMGYALAGNAAKRGANVKLISGHTSLPDPYGVEVIRVESALQMEAALKDHLPGSKVFISAAAVSDYRAAKIEKEKMKKTGGNITVEFIPNPDLLSDAGKDKGGRIHVGFAAETEDLKANAKKKLKDKNLDMIVANDLSRDDSGFGAHTNKALLIFRDGTSEDLPVMTKSDLAGIILDRVESLI